MKRAAGSLVLLALVAAALNAFSVSAVAGSAHRERVLVTNDLTEDQLYYRPHRFYLSGDGTFGMTAVKWQRYGGAVAEATATAYANDCKPYCAAGHLYRPQAKLRLSKVVECSGQPIYARLRYRLFGALPGGFPRQGTISMVPRAEDGKFEC